MAAKKGAPKPSYSKDIKEYVVQFLKNNDDVKRSQITKSTDGKVHSLETVKATAEIKEKVAHFWDAKHTFWKTAGSNGNVMDFGKNAKLPLGYILVSKWVKADKDKQDSQTDSFESDGGEQIALSYEDELKAHNRKSLLLTYKKDVFDAEKALLEVTELLASNPNIQRQEDLDKLLNPTS